MSPQKINEAIAEKCGWVEAFPLGGSPHKRTRDGGILLPYYWIHEPSGKRAQTVPDYVGDLNAMHEAEKALFENEEPERYREQLNKACGYGRAWKDSECCPAIVHATSAQRAEAFLRTLNLWEEKP